MVINQPGMHPRAQPWWTQLPGVQSSAERRLGLCFTSREWRFPRGPAEKGLCVIQDIYLAIPFCVRYTVCVPHNTLQLNIAPQHSQYLCKRVFQTLFVRVYVGGNGIPLLFTSTWWLPSLNPITWYNPTHHDPPLINPVILLLYPIIPPWFYHIVILHINM